jgi:hypothetical protein
MQWFLNLMEELEIGRLVGHPAEIRAAEPRKQKHDGRDADLILKLLTEKRFPAISDARIDGVLRDCGAALVRYRINRACRT